MTEAPSKGRRSGERQASGGERGDRGFGGTAGGLFVGVFVGVVCVLPGGGLLVGVASSEGGGGNELRLDVLGQLRTSPSCKGGGGGGNESRLSVLPVKSSGEGGEAGGTATAFVVAICRCCMAGDFEGDFRGELVRGHLGELSANRGGLDDVCGSFAGHAECNDGKLSFSGLCSGDWAGVMLRGVSSAERGGDVRLALLERGRLPCLFLDSVPVPSAEVEIFSSVCDRRRLIRAPDILPRLPLFLPTVS